MTLPDIQDLQHTVRSHARVQPRGARTKSAPPSNGAACLDLAVFSGVIDYQPTEFVITAWAGTPVIEVQRLLAEHGQYLPFDPLLVVHGATLGGTIAANACGPERYRYGGVRDFLIGVRFIDGVGELIRGGGNVVKNAAGFDYPKLMVGSLGALGVLTEVTFKVFPKPEAYATLRVECRSLDEALALLPKLTNCQLDLNTIDIAIETRRIASLHIRVGGLADALPQRMDRVRALCGQGDVILDEAEAELWQAVREFDWVADGERVAKVPLTPNQIASLDATLDDASRRYSVGGNVAWIGAPKSRDLHATLRTLGLSGLVLLNADVESDPHIGARASNAFAERAKRALDPYNKFG